MTQKTVEQAYQAHIDSGSLKADAKQREIIVALDALLALLHRRSTMSATFFSKLFGSSHGGDGIRGMYIWGGVGRGKSMLMDMFYEIAPVAKKKRQHFHAFMQEVHGHMHDFRQEGVDPIPALVTLYSQDIQLLCLDELQAPDITDATLLYRLFDGMTQNGMVIVSTSNRAPDELYQGGVQAERFEAFTRLILKYFRVMCLDSPTDYRQIQRHSIQKVYHYPLDKQSARFVEETLQHICADAQAEEEMLVVQKRAVRFTLYPPATGRFSFHELCGVALGAADYLALAARLDALILTDVPILSAEQRNEAKRFVTLIDALYEHKVLFICTADAAPDALYPKGTGSFEFARTASRLTEMQSQPYVHASR